MRAPRTLRAQVAVTAGLVAALAITVLVVAFNLVIAHTLDGDVDSRLRSSAAAAATTTQIRHGRVIERQPPSRSSVDRTIWIYSGSRAVDRAPGPPVLQRTADALAGRDDVFTDLPEDDIRLHATAIRQRGRQVGTVVVGESLATYDRTTELALAGSIGLGALLLAAVLALTWEATGRALTPVRAMARTAADWTANDLDQRFGHGPRPDELGELARTFDDLLERVAASLRHEQRLSAEISHELRTPLSRITAEAELLLRRDRPEAERRESLQSVLSHAREMEDILSTLMAAARTEAGLGAGRSRVAPTLQRLAERWGPVLQPGGAQLAVAMPPEGLQVGVEAEVVERIVTPLLDNAARVAHARVEVDVRQRNGAVELEVRDDGPGIGRDEREAIFVPGHRGTAAGSDGGAGLGLSLARRLARAAGGDVTVEDPGGAPGARLRVQLPA
jgi:signal transduction histidine kinase